ncbi:hypothetical protein DFJ73DRAFT_955771 [Zopfochytrium polystomum]|nr:hypothetical protein DFJ73DRAFT_955771 [Zopfochytrium polystomum]
MPSSSSSALTAKPLAPSPLFLSRLRAYLLTANALSAAAFLLHTLQHRLRNAAVLRGDSTTALSTTTSRSSSPLDYLPARLRSAILALPSAPARLLIALTIAGGAPAAYAVLRALWRRETPQSPPAYEVHRWEGVAETLARQQMAGAVAAYLWGMLCLKRGGGKGRVVKGGKVARVGGWVLVVWMGVVAAWGEGKMEGPLPGVEYISRVHTDAPPIKDAAPPRTDSAVDLDTAEAPSHVALVPRHTARPLQPLLGLERFSFISITSVKQPYTRPDDAALTNRIKVKLAVLVVIVVAVAVVTTDLYLQLPKAGGDTGASLH